MPRPGHPRRRDWGARFSLWLFGPSVWGLGLWPSLAGALMVGLAALIARELGGGRTARVLAALGAATSLILLGANWLFQTVTFDELVWLCCLWIPARLLRTGDSRLWLAFGVAIGIGLETKYTIVGLIAGGAALIMVATFLAFGLADVVLIKSIGIGIAIAIAIDATIVRALLVPSIMRLLGSRNWWAPRSLVRLHRRSGFGELAAGAEAA